jgi:Flp pilus assembly protein TadD
VSWLQSPGPADLSPAQRAYQQGRALFELGRHQEALEHLRQAAALEPGFPHPLCLIAAAHLRLGQASGALEAADAALGRQPEFGWPHRLRALALSRLGRKQEAKTAALQAVGLEPEEPYAYIVLSTALQGCSDEAGAAAAARHAVALNPESADTRIALGNILLAHEQVAEAEVEFRAALAIDPENSVAMNNLAAALGRQRKFDESVSGWEKASRSDPAFALPRQNLLRVGRRLAWPRRLAIVAVLVAAVIAAAGQSSQRWSIVGILLVFAAGLEFARWSNLRRLPEGTRTLLADDARARRRRPGQWDWGWPSRLRPWWWVMFSRLRPDVALLLNVVLFVLVLVVGNSASRIWAVLLGLALPASAQRAWKAWRRSHPGQSSWRPPEG